MFFFISLANFPNLVTGFGPWIFPIGFLLHSNLKQLSIR